MMAATMAEGVSVLTNAAQEPEVLDLAEFLIACGAYIEGAGTSTIVITGRKQLHGCEFTIIPDRIEAGTFMIAAAITRSCISLSPVIPKHLESLVDKLAIAGCKITLRGPRILEVSATASRTGGDLQSFDLVTSPYPGFPTDLQPQCISLLATCNGKSKIEESVFENRMHHVKELQKLGAGIELNGNSASVEGRTPWWMALRGSRVEAADLRGGAALVLAGMAAEGTTEVAGVAHIDRGYQGLETKLQSLGANIKREVDSMPQKQ
ncbi:UDP-N-acetylglucosamine 1-carboxyvinyltransferase protein [Dioscorea alata]|uniref:UDP-N-acetylglucosamine 1-carboxyvinyltransferase protein n=1 Tax=Dioscorea alata TaxID=55571 RepID=A0ACB7TV43_DIOAL|nr:UDP-N-acetylglucosamine 1-carboxyvinyltransferase protein [Dioscorea alata]